MFGLTTLRSVADAARERRRRRQAVQVLDGLPQELKKDIGWPAIASGHLTPRNASQRHLRG